ncbi:hotdog fold thioesterase [Seongchinamella sediminis]|uniref:Hotdog fold thioesterase n=1 Tax=Seongchinamella sediminis TaxID=2283635 RepID=A0A3L7E033_9GAMM|nr:PaaI family thioesterase [Seongchinamella sediminis]RLQ22874.1 hotdog fold thioesterase [Seongchinamella sediminis]
MEQDHIEAVPEGFELLPDGLGFTDNLKPCYRRLRDQELLLGLVVQPQHANSMGICHGGALMTLADIAAASWANLARGVIAGAPTINLSMDFISAGRQGQWLEARCEGVSLKRLFGFSRGVIVSSRGVVARFNATFYFPDHPGMSQDGVVNPGLLRGLAGDGDQSPTD